MKIIIIINNNNNNNNNNDNTDDDDDDNNNNNNNNKSKGSYLTAMTTRIGHRMMASAEAVTMRPMMTFERPARFERQLQWIITNYHEASDRNTAKWMNLKGSSKFFKWKNHLITWSGQAGFNFF